MGFLQTLLSRSLQKSKNHGDHSFTEHYIGHCNAYCSIFTKVTGQIFPPLLSGEKTEAQRGHSVGPAHLVKWL